MNDGAIIEMWLHGRSRHTVGAYRRDIDRFRSYVNRPLAAVALADLQRFADSLKVLAPASRARTLAALKSLYRFMTEQGLVAANPTVGLRLPRGASRLSERILPEEMVLKMVALEEDGQKHCLLRLLYASGIRVSECANLKWKDVQPHGEGGADNGTGQGRQGQKHRPARLGLQGTAVSPRRGRGRCPRVPGRQGQAAIDVPDMEGSA